MKVQYFILSLVAGLSAASTSTDANSLVKNDLQHGFARAEVNSPIKLAKRQDTVASAARVTGMLESPAGIASTETHSLTQTESEIVSSTTTSSVDSTLLSTILSTSTVSNTEQSTTIITSTTGETISTTATETSTVESTVFVTATETATIDGANPTASLVLTPQYVTVTDAIHDTVTVTVPASSGNAPANNAQPQVDGTLSTITETETISVTLTENNTIVESNMSFTVENSAVAPVIVTETVLTTVDPDVSGDASTATETVTVTSAANTITAYITITNAQQGTATIIETPTVEDADSATHELQHIQPVSDSEPESSSKVASETTSAPSKLSIGIIVGIILLLLAIIGLSYYCCIYKRKKKQQSNGYYREEDSGRIGRWIWDQPMTRQASYLGSKSAYSSYIR